MSTKAYLRNLPIHKADEIRSNRRSYVIDQFLTRTDNQTSEWLELAKEAWLHSDDGKHCPAEIVSEFNANMKAIEKLICSLREAEANYALSTSLTTKSLT